jgi:hypothetical protein
MIDDDEDDDAIDTGTGTESTSAPGQDAGGRDASPELPAEQPDDREVDGQPQPTGAGEPAAQSRGGARFQRLNDENIRLRDRLAQVERETAEARRAQWANNAAVNEQQERERLALMTDSERADYRINKMERDLAARSNADRMQLQLMMDKRDFDTLARLHPIYAKHRDEVEARFNEQLARGQPVERQIIFENLIGRRAIEQAVNGVKQARQGRQRVAAQRVEPASGRGDTASQRTTRARSTVEERLKDVFI